LLIQIRNRAITIIRTIRAGSIHTIHGNGIASPIKSRLAMLYAALPVGGFGGSRGCFFLFDFFVGNGAWNDVSQELEVI